MMTFSRPNAPSGEAKPAKRSVLGLLFNPQLGPAISPLRESTRLFLHLVASVFAIYGLLPKDYAGLRDSDAPLSLANIIGTAWQRVQFTRQGAPQAIIFIAVVGMMGFSAFAAIAFFLSLFIGHAHAATTMASSSAFQPEAKDLAQNWLDYLFIGPSAPAFLTGSDTYGNASATLADPFQGSVLLQKALLAILGFYSDAILIVAAIILFYHLTSMVLETAHSGVPMGKTSRQIWAPIRLVLAIGLLVPVNGGLSCGQFIVIKMAEMGSGLASQTWDVFLNNISYAGKPVAPSNPNLSQVGADMIRMRACMIAWNSYVTAATNSTTGLGVDQMSAPSPFDYNLGSIPGQKYSYSVGDLAGTDICGWYFVPDGHSNPLLAAAVKVQLSALNSVSGQMDTAAGKINDVLDNVGPLNPNGGASQSRLTYDDSFKKAVGAYQAAVNAGMSSIVSDQTTQISAALDKMKPYGWVMAGAFLNTIDRMQADLASAATDSTPKTFPPAINVNDRDKPESGFWEFNSTRDEAWDIRKQVAIAMANYDIYQGHAMENVSNTQDAQCAAMVGLSSNGAGSWAARRASDVAGWIFSAVDYLAELNGVWSAGSGTSCSNSSTPGVTTNTFSLGVTINGKDPFAQMAYLGHANLGVAFMLIAIGLGGSIGGAFMGPIAGGFMSAATGIIDFIALIFFGCGFTLAYMVPLMPFMRFFFAVLSWFAAVIEAVVAIPLVALAQLNPEGEGLAGQAKTAYFFIFNLFLRPVMTVFGLVCGLIMFMIALSFLNYAYAIAAAGAGGTAYGHAAMSRIIYSILYVAIVYICANHSFQLIDHIPEHALKWMGASGQPMPKMGDAGQVEQYGSMLAGYAGSKMMSSMQGSMGKIGGGFSSAASTRTATGAADRRHGEMIDAIRGAGAPRQIPNAGGEEGGANFAAGGAHEPEPPAGGGGGARTPDGGMAGVAERAILEGDAREHGGQPSQAAVNLADRIHEGHADGADSVEPQVPLDGHVPPVRRNPGNPTDHY